MIDNKIIAKYAKLFCSLRHKSLEYSVASLKNFCELLSSTNQLSILLSDPTIKFSIIENTIDKISEKIKLLDLVKKYLILLVKYKHIENLDLIINEIDKILLSNQNIINVRVKITNLDDSNKKYITDYLYKKIGKSIKIDFLLDHSLIKGYIIEYKDVLIDLSLKTALNLMQQKMLNISS
jgi:ATP synthase F1 delta subunit